MSEPKETPTIYNVVMQGMDVTSSLHCPPDPIKEPHEDAMFLDELDHWAQHASKHASAGIRAAAKLEQEMEDYAQQLLHEICDFMRDHGDEQYVTCVVKAEDVYEKIKQWIGRG